MPLNLERLRELREKRNLSQQAMSDAVGIHRISYINIETGKHPPTLVNLEAIAKALKVKPAAIIKESQ